MPLDFDKIDFDSLAPSEPVDDNLRASMLDATTVNPDNHAEIRKLSQQTGVPEFAVAKDKKKVEQRLNFDKIDFDKIESDYKHTAKYLSDPSRAKISHDSVDDLTALEKVLSPLASLTQTSLSIEEGMLRLPQFVEDSLTTASRFVENATGLPEYLDPVRGLETIARGYRLALDPLTESFRETSNLLPTLAEPFARVNKLNQDGQQAIDNAFKGDFNKLFDVLTDPESVSTYAAAAIPSIFVALASGGSLRAAAALEAGGELVEQAGFKAKNGEIPVEQRTQAVAQTALISGWLEKFGIDSFRRFPVFKKFFKEADARGVNLGDILKTTLTEVTTEGLQNTNQNIAAKITYDPNKSLTEGLLQSLVGATAGGGGVSTVGYVASKLDSHARKKSQNDLQHQQEQNTIDQIAEKTLTDKMQTLKGRDPESFKQFVEDAGEGANVFIDGEQAAIYMQNKTPEEIEADPALKLMSEQVREASKLKGDIVVPVAEFATNVVGTEHFDGLRPHMTMSAESVTPAKLEESRKDNVDYMQSLVGEAEKHTSEYAQAQELVSKYTSQLYDTGAMSEADARKSVEIYSAYVTVKAVESGQSIEQTAKDFGLTIEGVQTGKLAKLSPDVLQQNGVDNSPTQVMFEVAPNPDQHEASLEWSSLTPEQQVEVTHEVMSEVVPVVAADNNIAVKLSDSLGGFEGMTSPSILMNVADAASALKMAHELGVALDQKSMLVISDNPSEGFNKQGVVTILLPEGEDVHALYEKLTELKDDTGASIIEGHTTSNGKMAILNSSKFDNETLASMIDAHIGVTKYDIETKDSYVAFPQTEDYNGDSTQRTVRQRTSVLHGRRGSSGSGEQSTRDFAIQLRDTAVRKRLDASRAGRGHSLASPQHSPTLQNQRELRESDGSLKGLPRIRGARVSYKIQRSAEEYARSQGLEYNPPHSYAPVDVERAKRIAAEYEKAVHNPNDPETKAAYDAVIAETIEQYRVALANGLKVEFVPEGQPYPYEDNLRMMTEDVINNNHMWVFGTREGYGSDESFKNDDSPLLAETDFIISGQRALANDLFRVVHDYFGHAKESVGFRAGGEENAWRAHSAMFSPLARRALTTETRGQNSWLNYGKNGEHNRTAKGADTIFADQKITLLPKWVSEEGVNDAPVLFQSATEQAQRNNLGMYSQVEQTLLDMNVQQWKKGGVVDGTELFAKLKKSQGVKSEELETLGIEDYLKQDGKKFTREEVVEFVRNNGVVIEEVVADVSEEESSFEFDNGKVWDDPEAYQPDIEDDLYQYNANDGSDGDLIDISTWLDGWIENNEDKVMKFLRPRMDGDQLEAMDASDDPVQWAVGEGLLETDDADLRAIASDDFEEAVTDTAQTRYLENPVMIYKYDGETDDIYIFGNDGTGYSVRLNGLNYTDVILDDMWSVSEAMIQAEDYARENDMIANEGDPSSSKWGDYVAIGEHDNYRELKLTLPEVSDRDFEYNVHFDDPNIVAFLRVDDRTMFTGEPDTIIPDETVEFKVEVEHTPQYVVKRKLKVINTKDGSVLYEMGADSNRTDEELIKSSTDKLSEKGFTISNLTSTGDGKTLIKKGHSVSVKPRNTYFIDEFQSDWHQQGRQVGYSTGASVGDLDEARIVADEAANDKAEILVKSLYENEHLNQPNVLDHIIGETGPSSRMVDTAMLAAWRRTPTIDKSSANWMTIVQFVEQHGSKEDNKILGEFFKLKQKEVSLQKQTDVEEKGVPDAPFKGNEWMSLGLKRALIDAVEQGYDALAWVDSVVLSDRWSDQYRSLYENQYDKKMPSMIKKMTGIEPQHLDIEDGSSVIEGDQGYYIIPLTDELKKKITDTSFPLFQKSQNEARGYYDPSNTLIRLTESANLSTFLHEFAHFMYDMEKKTGPKRIESINNWFKRNAKSVAAEAKATEDDVIAYLDAGTTGDREVDKAVETAVHEQFARGFETYLMEGKAPSIELRNAFRAFARWLVQVYKNIKGDLKVNLDDEMRQVFDRLIATEDQIAAAEARTRFDPMFTDAAMAGMTEQEWKVYSERKAKVVDKGTETLRDKLIKQLTRQTEKWWKDEKADLIVEETARLKEERVYKARSTLRDGDFKIDRADVKKDYSVQVEDKKRGKTFNKIPTELNNMTVVEDGIHPDEAAALLGYGSGDEMIQDLITAPALNKAAEDSAQSMMLDKHGDILNDGSIEREADDAMNNEERGKLLLHELKVLSRGTNQAAIDRQTIKALAEDNIGKLAFRDIHPAKYRKAEVKAAKEAATALALGNTEGAAVAKTRQVLNYYLGMAATAAKDDTLKIVDRMARYRKKSVIEQIIKAGNGYWEHITRILSRFEFRKSATLAQVESENQTVLEWMNELNETQSTDLQLTNEILNEGYKAHWKDIPYNVLLGVRDSVANIEHVARYNNKMTLLEEEMDFKKLVNTWTTSIAENAKDDFKSSDISLKHRSTEKIKKAVRSALAEMTKVPFLASWLDGGERVGISHDILVQPLTDAYHESAVLWKKVGAVVVEAIEGRSKEDKIRHNKRIFVPSAKSVNTEGEPVNDGTFKMHQIIAVALNIGNKGNLKKMLLGEGWARPDVESDISIDNPILQSILSHMTQSDWDMVELVWGKMEELYPMLAEVHRKTTGLTPAKVEKASFTLPNGRVISGGYYPMKYDPTRSARAKENEDKLNASTDSMLNGVGSLRVQVSAGATNERTGFYAPVKLELSVIQDHLAETIHYITYHDAVRQINKLLRNKSVSGAISKAMSPEEFAQLRPWLNDVAKGARRSELSTFPERIYGKLKLGLTYGIMGFKASTGISQILGLSAAMAEVGSLNMAESIAMINSGLHSRTDAYEFAMENSKVMPHRMKTMDRELLNAMNNIEGKHSFMSSVRETSMMHIALIQTFLVDLPTWHAAYIKGLKDHDGNEAKALSYADWVVENVQGSGLTHNMSSIMRSQNKLLSTLTMFMTYFSAQWNMERDIKRGAQHGNYSWTKVAAMTMFTIMLPYIFDELFRHGFPDDDDDDDEDWLKKHAVRMAVSTTAGIPFIRDVTSAAGTEYDFSMTPVSKVLEEGIKGVGALALQPFVEDQFLTKHQVKSATQLIGAAFAVPAVNQLWATGDHLYDVMEEGEDLTTRQLIYGAKKN